MELSEEAEKKRFERIKSELTYQKISLPYEEVDTYEMDHSYDTPCNWWAVKSLAKPLKYIFGGTRSPDDVHPPQVVFDEEQYHRTMSSRKMNETQAYTQGFHEYDENEEVKEGRGKEDCPDPLSDLEQEIWDKAMDYLNSYKLARIAHHGHKNELIWRKLVVEKAAKRFRSLFVRNVVRNVRLLRWLHSKLIDELDEYFLQAYLEICQYLKRKIPATMKEVLAHPTSRRVDPEKAFNDKPWDPITPQVLSNRLSPLPESPILLLVPNLQGPTRLFNRWERHLSALGSLHTIEFCLNRATVAKNLDKTVANLKSKIKDLKEEHPEKQLILVGFNSGAALAIQVSRNEKVSAVVCLGFPSRTLEGRRGVGRDVLINQPSPILFIMGENSMTSNVQEMEMLRKRMNIGTSMVVVNGGDDQLRLSNNSLTKEGVTQTIVDRCVVEEMVEFLKIAALYPDNFVKRAKNLTAKPKPAETEGQKDENGQINSGPTPGTDATAGINEVCGITAGEDWKNPTDQGWWRATGDFSITGEVWVSTTFDTTTESVTPTETITDPTLEFCESISNEASGSAIQEESFRMLSEASSYSAFNAFNAFNGASSMTTDENAKKNPKRTRGGPRGRPRGRARGTTRATTFGVHRGGTLSYIHQIGSAGSTGLRGGNRGNRRGWRKVDGTSIPPPPPIEPLPGTSRDMGSVFKRPYHRPPRMRHIRNRPLVPIGSLLSSRNEIADCDSYIENLIEIMKLEDLMNNRSRTTVQEDEDTLANLLPLDDYL